MCPPNGRLIAMTALITPPETRGDSVKATVAERTRRQQTRRQDVPRHGHPAGMTHPATRLRLVADHGRLLPREQAVAVVLLVAAVSLALVLWMPTG
jgi:hypothetical protein